MSDLQIYVSRSKPDDNRGRTTGNSMTCKNRDKCLENAEGYKRKMPREYKAIMEMMKTCKPERCLEFRNKTQRKRIKK
jgi:ribosomal protein L20